MANIISKLFKRKEKDSTPSIEQIRESEEYKKNNPLYIKWLIYRNGEPYWTWNYAYITVDDGKVVVGVCRTHKSFEVIEVMQLANGIQFPRSIQEAIEDDRTKGKRTDV